MPVKKMIFKNPEIFIGTSGWCYDGWEGVFYPDNLSRKEWLGFYAKHFDTVEINSSFYHLPKASTFSDWAKKTPDDFLFVVKASKCITHTKRLNDCSDAVARLIGAAVELGKKLVMFLFQLPPNLKKDLNRLKNFIDTLPAVYRYVFEFRDESWFCNDIYKLLKDCNCGIVISDSPRFPRHEVITGGFCYIRMHGSTSLYSSKYTDKELKIIAEMITGNYKNGISSYVFFNNDVCGYAVENAKLLKSLLLKAVRRK